MTGYVFPTDAYNEEDVSLATVPKAFIPFFRLLWETLQARDTWYDRESWFRGYQTAAWLEEMLMTATLRDLVEGQKRIYRLLDTALNGTTYTVTPAVSPLPDPPADPTMPTIAPAIPDAPPATEPQLLPLIGFRRRFERLVNLVDNLTTGQPFILAEGDIDDSDSVRAVLRRAIAGLDGGGDAPEDNVLLALRGTTSASADRNVIDTQGGNLTDLLDDVETLLADIKAALQ